MTIILLRAMIAYVDLQATILMVPHLVPGAQGHRQYLLLRLLGVHHPLLPLVLLLLPVLVRLWIVIVTIV